MPKVAQVVTFLFKTEPGEYSFADLEAAGKCTWDGVDNPAAVKALRSVRAGDEALIYHTGDEKAVVGLARVTGDARPDPQRPENTASGEPRFAVVDLVPVQRARTPVTLAAIKADPRFKDFALVRQGRLSVMPVPAELDAAIRVLAGLEAAASPSRRG